jgi:hypothetical protein
VRLFLLSLEFNDPIVHLLHGFAHLAVLLRPAASHPHVAFAAHAELDE